MKIDEIKMRLHRFINNTIDLYLPPVSFFDKMKNSTAKLWLEQNMWKLDKALDTFGDENKEIDVDKVMDIYQDALFENGEMKLDIKGILPDSFEWLKDMLPNKIILFKVDDFKHIFL
ncbi:MAG: hypothetical protein IKT40_05965 [Bacilli bacterium]|nr:hypothetical protein [Bacilli bacterium]